MVLEMSDIGRPEKMESKVTKMTILGCGRLGSAILLRLVRTIEDIKDERVAVEGDQVDRSSLPSSFIACVSKPESVEILKRRFSDYVNSPTKAQDAYTKDTITSSLGVYTTARPAVQVWSGRNAEAVRQAAIILVACQPGQVPEILAEDGLALSLKGKLVLNICAGSSEPLFRQQIQDALIGGCGNGNASSQEGLDDNERYYMVHAMPNPASIVGQSATVLNPRPRDFPKIYDTLTKWIFGSIGDVFEVPPELMNAASMVAGCPVAFLAPALMGVTAGGVAAGLDEKKALRMAAQAMKGTAEMILSVGEDPKELMDKVATPGGCTERGLQTLLSLKYEGSVAMAFELATKRAIARAFELGGGTTDFNGEG